MKRLGIAVLVVLAMIVTVSVAFAAKGTPVANSAAQDSQYIETYYRLFVDEKHAATNFDPRPDGILNSFDVSVYKVRWNPEWQDKWETMLIRYSKGSYLANSRNNIQIDWEQTDGLYTLNEAMRLKNLWPKDENGEYKLIRKAKLQQILGRYLDDAPHADVNVKGKLNWAASIGCTGYPFDEPCD